MNYQPFGKTTTSLLNGNIEHYFYNIVGAVARLACLLQSYIRIYDEGSYIEVLGSRAGYNIADLLQETLSDVAMQQRKGKRSINDHEIT